MPAKVLSLPALTTDDRRAAEASASEAVWEARAARGWSQERLARWLGVSDDSVSLWERGIKRVPAWVLKAFERAEGRAA